jgi:hypothetical protein
MKHLLLTLSLTVATAAHAETANLSARDTGRNAVAVGVDRAVQVQQVSEAPGARHDPVGHNRPRSISNSFKGR